MDYSILKPRQRELIFAGQNPAFWKTEKNINRNTAKKKRADYLQLYKTLAEQNTANHDLENRLKDKFEYLISN